VTALVLSPGVARVRENSDLFEAHQGLDDLDRVSDDEGAAGTLAHTTIRNSGERKRERKTGFEPATLTLARCGDPSGEPG
jgi:hypothetical protein